MGDTTTQGSGGRSSAHSSGSGSGHGSGHGGHGSMLAPPSTTAEQQQPVQPRVPKEERSTSFAVQELTAFYSGIMFFTRLSVPKWVNHSMYWLSLSTVYFPIIGVIVALVGAAAFCVAYYLFPASTLLPAVAYTVATIRFTGAFHEDGLADMGDGFGGGWRRESILRIMRDSAIGTFGALALILMLFTKTGAIMNLIEFTPLLLPAEHVSSVSGAASLLVLSGHMHKLARLTGTFVTAHVFARWSCTYLLYRYKYVENASAVGKEFLLSVTPIRCIMATLSTAVIVAMALASHDNYLVQMGVAWIVAVWVTVYWGAYVNRIIGGVIGDCLGATNQIVEVSMYLVLGIDWVRVFADGANGYLLLKTFVDSFIKS